MTKQELINLISSVDVPDDSEVSFENYRFSWMIELGFTYNTGYDGAFKEMKSLEISFDS